MQSKITLAHGSGGRDSAVLMRDIFGRYFSNPILDRLEDGAVLAFSSADDAGAVVVSTDSFVVTPIEFAGGDIGKLSVCGTVNDVLMMGAHPKYLTCGFILEEGLETVQLDKIASSMAKTASAAGVQVVAGDTKVISGSGGLFINTTGIGVSRKLIDGHEPPSAAHAMPGDAVIVSGNLGDHHACILSARMGIGNGIKSDCAVLSEIVDALYASGVGIHTMRDVTRGGLATVLNEISAASGVRIELSDELIPVDPEVRAFCGVMGLDPLYMGNEGKMIAIVPAEDAARALEAMRSFEIGKNAGIIGSVTDDLTSDNRQNGFVTIRTKIGGTRRIDMLFGEGLPRIC
ncbi:MAG: hydrogenase expression/formation protein HypE [Clostridiales Family XIII bacterium]|nr:hydrogenase expression/formation protein HypE [Clostridiales Family XIII bacterium]